MRATSLLPPASITLRRNCWLVAWGTASSAAAGVDAAAAAAAHAPALYLSITSALHVQLVVQSAPQRAPAACFWDAAAEMARRRLRLVAGGRHSRRPRCRGRAIDRRRGAAEPPGRRRQGCGLPDGPRALRPRGPMAAGGGAGSDEDAERQCSTTSTKCQSQRRSSSSATSTTRGHSDLAIERQQTRLSRNIRPTSVKLNRCVLVLCKSWRRSSLSSTCARCRQDPLNTAVHVTNE